MLPHNSVIVMDNSPYHSRKSEKIATSNWKKVNIQEWLRSKNISFSVDMIHSQLLHLLRLNKNRFNSNVVDEMATKAEKIILRLPPYHCRLKPIELVWAQMKGEVASRF
ncbi:hypothetical protein AMK59_21 [Oryctes borbonicus]|uniref:Tc1-like transposase DDE domain-containing protein n=1 Tax=Oryctes borbonicus TaxID=1629725 RepID=A0A0T6BGN2_9SCAR|nr:hypothetical protein AMK59_21 [Oryctes borbonicus]